MRLNTPDFWYDRDNALARAKASALAAFSALYTIGHLAHSTLSKPVAAEIPVVCIGNLVAGGGGKTPVAIALMRMIRDKKIFKNPCFLSRGYGGTHSRGMPFFINTKMHTAAMTGDEPLLLAREAPVVISADRRAGARLAAQAGHDVIVMDDGLQNPSLLKDLSIVVVDGRTGFGNEHMIPAGPLRTPIHRGMTAADCIILIGADTSGCMRHIPDGKPVFRATVVPRATLDTHRAYIGFCGIAHPEKFRATLHDAGLNILEFLKFPDHHSYTPGDLDKISGMAAARNASLVTTEKDAARLPVEFMSTNHVNIMTIDLEWHDHDDESLSRMIAGISR